MLVPSPPELFARYENGEIDRDELHALMAVHARGLIDEMEEDHRNPVAAWWEGVLARRAMQRLVQRHGARLLREVIQALADAEFPAARHLWNAGHPDLPLHCFLRMKRPPVFRILTLRETDGECVVTIEADTHGAKKPSRLRYVMRRDHRWSLRLVAGD